jgi:hypothetical protein
MVTSRPNPAFDRKFPAAAVDGYDERSERDPDYNCVAWAVDQNAVIWWPFPDAEDIGVFWPAGVDRAETVQAFVAALAPVGYADCGMDGTLVPGVEKVAIYATESAGVIMPQHLAWQMETGVWSSKIGVRGRDIVHTTPAALESGTAGYTPYGRVVKYLCKSRRARLCEVPASSTS